MTISGVSSPFYQSVQPSYGATGKIENTTSLIPQKSSQTDSVSISTDAQNRLSQSKTEVDIASRYDLTNISYNEKVEMGKELLANESITNFEYALMTFPHDFSGITGVKFDPNEKVDFHGKMKSQLEFMQSHAGTRHQDIVIQENLFSDPEDEPIY